MQDESVQKEAEEQLNFMKQSLMMQQQLDARMEHPSRPAAQPQPPAEQPLPNGEGSLSEILASMGCDSHCACHTQAPSEKQEETLPLPDSPAAFGKDANDDDSDYPDIMLFPLARQDSLRVKWNLGNGLPTVYDLSAAHKEVLFQQVAPAPSASGHLRLFGLLPSGEPWEARIPFNDIRRAEDGYILGRDPNTCHLVVPEDSVSRNHAKLEITPDGLVITDMGSRNGVFINDRRLAPYDRRTPLSDGCALGLGDASLLVEILS